MILSTEKLYEALDLISKGVCRPTRIAKAMGLSYRRYCTWMVMSNSGDERFIITFQNQEMQWAKAIALSTRLAALELRGLVLQEAIFGYDEEQTKDGDVVWKKCPAACAYDPETRVMLGFREDGLATDENGALVPHTVRKKAPFAQQIRLLEAVFPDLRPSQTITQNVNLADAVGIGYAPKTDYSKGPPVVPPPPPMPQIEAPITDAEFNEVAAPDFVDDDLDELLGPDPVAVNVSINVEMPPEGNVYSDQPSAREASPAQTGLLRPRDALDVTRASNPTPLQQSLYDAIDAAKARRDQGK